MSLVLRQHLDFGPGVVDPRRPDEDAPERLVLAGHVQIGFEAVHLAAPRVPRHLEVDETEMVAVEHDHPRAGRRSAP